MPDWMLPLGYTVIALAVAYMAILVFRRVRHDYAHLKRLTKRSTFFQFLIFGVHGFSSGLYVTVDLPRVRALTAVTSLALLLLALGLAVVVVAMSQLGWRRSIGRQVDQLTASGIYRWSRNPQIVGYALVLIGYALLEPRWPGVVWLLLYAWIAHLMVRTEEEHLRNVFRESYGRYCQQVPRYVGVPS